MSGKSLFRTGTSTSSPARQRAAKAASRALMLEHYEQHLRTSTSHNGRPYARETIKGLPGIWRLGWMLTACLVT
jgi:hypothetical protein